MTKPSPINSATSSLPAVLAMVLGLSCAAPAFCQDLAFSQSPKFKLKATVEDRPQLSRSDMSAGAPGDLSTPDKGPAQDALDMPEVSFNTPAVAPSNPGFSLNALQEDQIPPAVIPQTQTAPPKQPDGVMSEYGVDWNKWIGQVADRWFVVLQKMEAATGMNFHTTGPALISFTSYPDGHIDNVQLKQSSGIPFYDNLQMQALLNSQPVPPFPRGTKRTSFTLVQGWESHPRKPGENDYQVGSFRGNIPLERIKQWINFHQ